VAAEVTSRKTKETDITISLDITGPGSVSVDTGVPFFDHLLTAMAFHGGLGLDVVAKGDIEVDPHHLVEDIGLVLGDTLKKSSKDGMQRYGHAVVPMDDALSEAVIDACGRPYLEYRAAFPQERSGDFDMWLIREFLLALSNRAMINIHALCRYGENSHHMAESLFKALGIAIKAAFTPTAGGVRSTKGVLRESGEN
jgi:imidazoleglycerol-phosphate dehydratase